MEAKGTITIWDADGPLEDSRGVVVLWRSLNSLKKPKIISLPELVEENASALRAQYLAWIYDLGESEYKETQVTAYFQLSKYFNYWPMTALMEKCNYDRSPGINDSIRLLAFLNWLRGEKVDRLILVSTNKNLANCFRLLTKDFSIDFVVDTKAYKKKLEPLPRVIYQTLPPSARGLLWLARYVGKSWPLRGIGLKKWRDTQENLLIVSYLSGPSTDKKNKNYRNESYWGPLPDLLRLNNRMGNWIIINPDINNRISSHECTDSFHQSGARGAFSLLGSFVTSHLVMKSLYEWFILISRAYSLSKHLTTNVGDGKYIWPLIVNDWRESVLGQSAISNIVNHNLFAKALRMLPEQQLCIYLQENQCWESSLIQAWRASGHKKIVGIPHTSVRFWDLRYFYDERYLNRKKCKLGSTFLPDKIASNGSLAHQQLVLGGYDDEQIVKLEALRYLHLIQDFFKPDVEIKALSRQRCRVLVIGDYSCKYTNMQLSLLNRAIRNSIIQYEIFFKPHPAATTNSIFLEGLRLTIIEDSLRDVFEVCDLVYTSNSTTGAVEAYYLGLPVVTFYDPATLNMSPLRGFPDVVFVSDHVVFKEALNSLCGVRFGKRRKSDLFNLNSSLPEWKLLLFS